MPSDELVPVVPSAELATIEDRRLAAIDEASDQYANTLRPHNTTRGYASDWKSWVEFCELTQLSVTDARRGTLRGFVSWLWNEKGRAQATIDRKLSGVVVTLRREHRIVVNKEDSEAARMLLKDLVRASAQMREDPRGRGKAPAMSIEVLRAAVASCPDTLTGVRDRAVLLVGFAVAGRRHEVAALSVRDFQVIPGKGMLVDIRVSKTHPRVVPVPYGNREDTCPVRAWLAWKDAAGLDEPGTPAFRRMHKSGSATRAGLTPEAIGGIITASGQRTGEEVKFTGHSVRSGMITAGRKAGKDRKALAAISGHVDGSKVLDGYIQIVDQWNDQDNGLSGIGL